MNSLEPEILNRLKELRRIEREFIYSGFSIKFINDTTLRLNKEKKYLLILKWLFDERKLVVIILHFATKNEKCVLEVN